METSVALAMGPPLSLELTKDALGPFALGESSFLVIHLNTIFEAVPLDYGGLGSSRVSEGGRRGGGLDGEGKESSSLWGLDV